MHKRLLSRPALLLSTVQSRAVPRRSSSMQVGAAGTHSRTSSAGEAAQARPLGLRHVHTGSRDSGQLGTGGTPGTGSTPDSSARSGRGAGRTPFANSPKAAAQIPWQAPPPVEIADALREQQVMIYSAQGQVEVRRRAVAQQDAHAHQHTHTQSCEAAASASPQLAKRCWAHLLAVAATCGEC